MKRPTTKQSALIRPFGECWLKMQQLVADATDAELNAAEAAAAAHTTSNCSWNEFMAARELLPIIQAEQRHRCVKEKA